MKVADVFTAGRRDWDRNDWRDHPGTWHRGLGRDHRWHWHHWEWNNRRRCWEDRWY
jgi:hypothetical protein